MCVALLVQAPISGVQTLPLAGASLVAATKVTSPFFLVVICRFIKRVTVLVALCFGKHMRSCK
jgi:hypothetical protein